MTALSATTFSGYVDTSAVWNPGNGNQNPPPVSFLPGKQDGFNLDVVDVKFAKEIDPASVSWAAGYTAELNIGPDASGITGSTGDIIRQAYVKLRAPVGNGLDFKIGRVDNLLGYESTDSYKNPNWSHSYGFTLEPTEHTGVISEYRFNDWILADVGVANTVTTGPINGRSPRAESQKSFLSLLTLTVPDGKLGLLSGDALYAGFDFGTGATTGRDGENVKNKKQLYIGSTINTPLKDLTLGVGYDAVWHNDVNGVDLGYAQAIAGYMTYKITEKFSASGRVDYASGKTLSALTPDTTDGVNTPGWNKVLGLTGTLSYDLWANVLTRLEVRWDRSLDATTPFGSNGAFSATQKNAVMLAANVVYKF